MYTIKEMFYTLQGEGHQQGRPSVFIRFSGCNLWSGREEDRYKAICKFCDTDFWGIDGENGGKYSANQLANLAFSLWPENSNESPYAVCTGGEPLLQLDEPLIQALHDVGFIISIETNGTIQAPAGIDWICVSPKANTEIIQKEGNELKIVFPQEGIDPKDFENSPFDHFYLQPMESDEWESNIKACINYCKSHPKWRMSIQMHKYVGIK